MSTQTVEEFTGRIVFPTHSLKLKEEEYVHEIAGDFVYEVYTIQKAYDENGKFIQEIKTKPTITTKSESTISNYYGKQVIQYNFQFFKVPIGRCWSQDEVKFAENVLQTAFPDIFTEHISDLACLDIEKASKNSMSMFQKAQIIKKYNIDSDCEHMGFKNINEICIPGNTYKICSPNVCINLEEYKKRADEAIEKWPDYKNEIEFLYNLNLGLINLKNSLIELDFFSLSVKEDDKFLLKYSINFSFCLKEKNKTHKIFGINSKADLESFEKLIEEIKSKGFKFTPKQDEQINSTSMFIKELLMPVQNQDIVNTKSSFSCFNNKAIIKTYLMKDENTGFYKIGKSNNPQIREKTLQSEKPTIKIVKVWEQDIEKRLHAEYNEYRVRGEWFNLTNVQVNYICTHFGKKQKNKKNELQ